MNRPPGISLRSVDFPVRTVRQTWSQYYEMFFLWKKSLHLSEVFFILQIKLLKNKTLVTYSMMNKCTLEEDYSFGNITRNEIGSQLTLNALLMHWPLPLQNLPLMRENLWLHNGKHIKSDISIKQEYNLQLLFIFQCTLSNCCKKM